MSEEVIKCSICLAPVHEHSHNGEVYWSGGHNAQPITDGRACDSCNNNIVLVQRFCNVGRVPMDSQLPTGKELTKFAQRLRVRYDETFADTTAKILGDLR